MLDIHTEEYFTGNKTIIVKIINSTKNVYGPMCSGKMQDMNWHIYHD